MTTFDSNIDIHKDMVRSSADGYALQDQTTVVNMGNLASPQLLTVLMGGTHTSENYLKGNIFQYDESRYTPQSFSGKSFSERGKDLKKDKSSIRFYEVGSKGLRLNVAVEDYDGKRKPGTNELKTEADVLQEQINKANDAAAFDMELDLAQLLTTGTNRVAGGPFTSYDFHQDILGSGRPSAVRIDFASATENPAIKVGNSVQKLQNKIKLRAIL